MRLALLSLFAAVSSFASAVTFSLSNPVVTPNQAGTFSVAGTVTMGAGETLVPISSSSQLWVPALPSFTAAFNALMGFDPAFVAWTGTSPYVGNVINLTVNPSNLGYSGGMPIGLYDSNPIGPGGKSAFRIDYLDNQGLTRQATSLYNVTVVPEPVSMIGLSMGALALMRRRRSK